MDYIIAIPSFKRAKICNEQTLKTLSNNSINPELIFIYVANENEYSEYQKELDPKMFNKIIIGFEGLVNQRIFIRRQWEENKLIVSMDDDVKSIDFETAGYKSLDDFIRDAFTECKNRNAFIWGVYPVYNPFFRKNQKHVTTCLNYIVGCFYGYINRPELKTLDTTFTMSNGQKEDVELSIRYFIQDGLVLRFNKVGFVTKYYGTVGGLGTFKDRILPMREASECLSREYPTYGKIKIRKNGMYEFVLKKICSK